MDLVKIAGRAMSILAAKLKTAAERNLPENHPYRINLYSRYKLIRKRWPKASIHNTK